ncbi:MAG: hypothetical protein ACREBW_00075, partial [Candidatus Micrarchaeaceae archaeon]
VSGIALAFLLYVVESLDERRLRVRFSLLIAVFIAVIAVPTLWVSHRVEGSAFLFDSRLPLLSLSYLWSAALVIAAWFLRKRMPTKRHFTLSVLAAFVPVIMMNQQIVTGVMIQALNWERYVNYTYVALSLLTLLSAVATPSSRKTQVWHPAFGHFFLIIGMLLLVYLQFRSYADYWYYNIESLAYTSALQDIYRSSSGLPRQVVLGDMSLDEQVRPRLRNASIAINGYATVVKSIGASERTQRNELLGFEYAFYQGLSPKLLGNRLRKEIHARTCWPNTMYFFDFLHCAPYMSDFRKYDQATLLSRVGAIVDNYRKFIEQQSCSVPPVLFVTMNNVSTINAPGIARTRIFDRKYQFSSHFGAAPQQLIISAYREAPSPRHRCVRAASSIPSTGVSPPQ